MAGKRVGRAPIGSAVLLITVLSMFALSRMPLFGLEWLYWVGARLTAVAWEVSPALCLLKIAVAGGTVGHRLAMKDVADQLVREQSVRRSRSTTSQERAEIQLQPVRIAISPPNRPQSSVDHDQDI